VTTQLGALSGVFYYSRNWSECPPCIFKEPNVPQVFFGESLHGLNSSLVECDLFAYFK